MRRSGFSCLLLGLKVWENIKATEKRRTCSNFSFFLKVFLIETDGRLFVWIGKDASSKEKQNAMSYAQVSDEATFNYPRIKSWNVWKGIYHECQRADFLLRHLYDILSTDCLHCLTSRFSICLEREDMRLFDLKWLYNHYPITAIYARKVFKKNSPGLEKQS